MRTSRIRLLEIIVAVSVVVISLASVIVAVQQSRVMQAQLAASVMPVVDYEQGNLHRDYPGGAIYLSFTNNGLGPADIRSLTTLYDGEPIRNPPDFLGWCCTPDSVPDEDGAAYVGGLFQAGELRLISSFVDGRIMAPGQRIDMIIMPRPDPETAPQGFAVWSALNDIRGRIGHEICYCSVLDECWRARFPEQRREPVRSCTARE
ncbi:MAG: hypothetical protein RIA71_16300 [Oceanicaulis sp.]